MLDGKAIKNIIMFFKSLILHLLYFKVIVESKYWLYHIFFLLYLRNHYKIKATKYTSIIELSRIKNIINYCD